ncbi:MAG: SpoIIE family protein phosphatase [Thermodesulfobacteriota bacterium]
MPDINQKLSLLVAVQHPETNRMLEHRLREWGYDPLFVKDGNEAWDRLDHAPFRLVLASLELPGISGPELCRKIRAAGFPFYVYIIVVTPETDRSHLVRAMEAGADEFIIEPFPPLELKARIQGAQRILSLEEKLARQNRDLTETNEKLIRAQEIITRDLEAAARIQQGLLPCCARDFYGYSFESLFIPCRVVGGDMFNFFPVNHHHLAFYLLDVSGHGIPAAMMSVAISKTISSLPMHEDVLRGISQDLPQRELTSPATVVRELDQLFQSNEIVEQYFTMIYGVLDREKGTARFTQAGHPHPVYVPHDGEPQLVGSGGLPVGLVAHADFSEAVVELLPYDRLVLYSDGVVECSGPDGERFDTDRLMEFLKTHRDLPLNLLMRRLGEVLYRFHGSDNFDDDMSVLVIQREED